MNEKRINMKASTFAVLLAALCMATTTSGQKLKERMAEKYLASMDLPRAIEVYEDMAKKDQQNLDLLRDLAETYHLANDPAGEMATRAKMVGVNDVAPEDLWDYAQCLRDNGKYEEAMVWYQNFHDKDPNDPRGKMYVEDKGFFERMQRDKDNHDIRKLQINSENSDFGMTFMDDLVIFSSARGEGVGGKHKYGWDQQPFINIHTALRDSLDLKDPLVMRKDINSRFHDGTVSYDPQAKRMYFTRNNYHYGVISESEEGEVKLGIFFSDIEAGEYGNMEWTSLVPFDHNDPEYNVGHPCVSPDGNWIYFTSDMPGGKGGTDIWRSKNGGSMWGQPENMASINTAGNEMFPFVSPDGKLFFSSDGHKGLGGLDVFYAQLTDNGTGSVRNMGMMLNSQYDDHSVLLMEDGVTGFFASNRPGGAGSDDIYGLTIKEWPNIFITGIVVDRDTREPIENATILLKDENNVKVTDVIIATEPGGKFQVDAAYHAKYTLVAVKNGYFQKELEIITEESPLEDIVMELVKYDYAAEGLVLRGEDDTPLESAWVRLYDANDSLLAEMQTLDDGKYAFPLSPESDYTLRAESEGRFKQSVRISTKNKQAAVIYTDFRLHPLEVNTIVKLENIYYDYNSAKIRSDAALELDKLAQTLRDNPTVKIELSSHTDSRGSDGYNKRLSQQRAQSAVTYIIGEGIAKERIVAKGYGEEQLVNGCKDGVECSDEEHQANRRTEFKVLEK